MIGVALQDELVGTSAIAAIVSTRVYPVTLPQTPTLPAITYQVIAEPRTHTMDNRAAPNPYVTIDCWARTFLEACTLADAVVTKLDGYRGTMGGAIAVTSCLQRARREIYEPETKEWRVGLDFSILHNGSP